MMNKIKECREKAGLSQKYVALTLGVRAPSVSDWEQGKNWPSIDNLLKLAELYNVTVDELLGRATSAEIIAMQAAGVSLDEKHILLLYRALSDQGKEYIFQKLLEAQHTMRKDAPGEGASFSGNAPGA